MDKLSTLLCLGAALAVISSFTTVCSASSETPAPAPRATCDDVIFNMIDCTYFISAGSSQRSPNGSCCTGVKSVLDVDGSCICVAIKSSSQLGIELNMTRVQDLASLCKLKPYPIEKCGISGVSGPSSPAEPPQPKSPAPAPPKSETPAPSPPKSEAPAPSPPKSEAPAPSPPKSEAPAPSPAKSSSPAPSSPKSNAPAPSAYAGGDQAPAEAPMKAGCRALTSSSLATLFSIFLIIGCHMFA